MILTDANSGYHSLILNKKCSFLSTSTCQLSRYRFSRLLFRVTPAGDMLQQKIDKTFKNLPNVFGIADDISIVGYDNNSRVKQQIPEISNGDMPLRKSKTK